VIGSAGELLKIKKEIPFNWFIWKHDHNYISPTSAFWRKTLYEHVKGLDESFELGMDGDLWARFAERTRPRHVSDSSLEDGGIHGRKRSVCAKQSLVITEEFASVRH